MRDDPALNWPALNWPAAAAPAVLPGQIVRQARRARMHGIVPPCPALIRVVAGAKEVAGAGLTLQVTPGGFVLLPEGLALTICNIPDARGHYEAQALPLPRVALERAAARLPGLTRPRLPAPQPLAGLPPAAVALFAQFFAPSALQDQPAGILALRLEELALWLALAGVTPAPEGPPRAAERLRAAIAAAPAGDWTAARAARLLAMSEATLRRRLAAEGHSFGALLREGRLNHALGLLQTTAFPVARVAAEAGYASPQQFATRFRTRFGLAPHEIRQPEAQIERIGAEAARGGAMAGPASG